MRLWGTATIKSKPNQNCKCILNVPINFKNFKTRYRFWVWVLFRCVGFRVCCFGFVFWGEWLCRLCLRVFFLFVCVWCCCFFLTDVESNSTSGFALGCGQVNPPSFFGAVFSGALPSSFSCLWVTRREGDGKAGSLQIFYFWNWREFCSFCAGCRFLPGLVFAVRMRFTRKNGVQCFILIFISNAQRY